MEDSQAHTLQLVQSKLLSKYAKIQHACFQRHGGVSQAPFDSLNFGDDIGDSPESVATNIQRAKDLLNVSHLLGMKQVHGTRVVEATPSMVTAWPEADALCTQTPGLGLFVKHADCQPALFYDYQNHALGLVHSGWRGNVQNIYAVTFEFMQQYYGTLAENLVVWIGPSLGPEGAEFKDFDKIFPPEFRKYRLANDHFDLWALAKDQILKLGVPESQIEISGICTWKNPQDYFSYRRDGVTGRHGTLAVLL